MVDPGESEEQSARRLLIADPDSRLRSEISEFCRQDGFEVGFHPSHPVQRLRDNGDAHVQCFAWRCATWS